jgi:ABC-2 type transport system permease protein
VRQLHDEGTTVLLVTHEMDEAEALCGRVVVMRAGREVETAGARVTVRGARTVIAYVGAALVGWGLVPADLSVHVPTLAVHDGWRVAVALAFGAVGFVSLGVLLGTVLPSARSAQAVGLLLFFPSFLLGAGGPPPHVMGSVVRHVAGPLPLTLLTNAVREPWLGLGSATTSLVALVALTVTFTAVAARRAVL